MIEISRAIQKTVTRRSKYVPNDFAELLIDAAMYGIIVAKLN